MAEEIAELAEEVVVTSRFDGMTDDQFLRLYLFDKYADAQIDGKIMAQNLDWMFEWIKTRALPETKPKSKLKEVT